MLKTTCRLALSVVLVLSFVGSASAATEAELLASANALLLFAEDVEAQVDACSDGSCSDLTQLDADLASAEAQLAALQAARASLQGCGCSGLDALIASIDSVVGLARATRGHFDDQD